ncbi:MAG: hypothetical protein OP8BY_2221 [Candidatus Saccharicenans subterraneus]|uniref:Uncharacterized protein n=1 Tax=Candidatus Saccharicenans subterraneus TaxID=2508984 RepID=A0A3E2BM46_9BACT|nr:MAG: hypothetical protein OP8BY_2221 [Candidatus Saccharicenans subterraneum]
MPCGFRGSFFLNPGRPLLTSGRPTIGSQAQAGKKIRKYLGYSLPFL